MLLILKRQGLINTLSFFLLSLILVANTFFSIRQFGIIEQFNDIQKNLPLFTESFVIVFITSVQLIAGITVVIMETLFVTFVANFMTKKKLKFSNYMFPILLANIFSTLLNMTIIKAIGLNDMQNIPWLIWSPVSQILLAVYIYIPMVLVERQRSTSPRTTSE
ncbi:hypothetical protein NSS70_15795 [Aeribacillus sp. FSL K6-2848]|uniref:hypothetical protein n=1 Tax=Aeribacillus sp. FSL K6-2848 TaxID=2954612 RepID=UPI0030FCF26F